MFFVDDRNIIEVVRVDFRQGVDQSIRWRDSFHMRFHHVGDRCLQIIQGAQLLREDRAQQLARAQIDNQKAIDVRPTHALQRAERGQIRPAGMRAGHHDVFRADQFRRIPDSVFADEIGDELIGRIFQNIFRCVILRDHAFVDNANAIAQTDRFVHIMRDEYDRFMQFVLQRADFVLQRRARERIQRGKRLVH